MKFEDMRNKAKKVTIKDIKNGECFICYEDYLCMKIEENPHYNAIVLSNGHPWVCDEYTPVIPVKTHIVIEPEE